MVAAPCSAFHGPVKLKEIALASLGNSPKDARNRNQAENCSDVKIEGAHVRAKDESTARAERVRHSLTKHVPHAQSAYRVRLPSWRKTQLVVETLANARLTACYHGGIYARVGDRRS